MEGIYETFDKINKLLEQITHDLKHRSDHIALELSRISGVEIDEEKHIR